MAFWEWDSSLNIGIDSIDEQHKRIVDYLNVLDNISNDKNTLKIQEVVNGLVEYTITHFNFEEEMMANSTYPFLASHKRIHTAFISRINTFKERLENGEDITTDLMHELKIWLTAHIKKDDRDYSPFVKKVLRKQTWLNDLIKKFFG